MNKQIVLDSSVALKWIFRNEEATDQADKLLWIGDYDFDTIPEIVPPE